MSVIMDYPPNTHFGHLALERLKQYPDRVCQVELRNCAIARCGVGIQMYSGSRVKLTGTVISDCSEQSIRCELGASVDSENAGMDGLEVAPNCKIGDGNLQQEVLVVKQDTML